MSSDTPSKRYYWDTPLSGTFDLEAVQAQIREMTDEEVARAVLAIRLAPKGHGAGNEPGRPKSEAVKAAEKKKRLTQKELIAQARAYLESQQMALLDVPVPTPQEELQDIMDQYQSHTPEDPDDAL